MSRTKNPETIALETLTTTIRANLITNPAWVERAILVLFERQTQDEQTSDETRHDNNMGFTSADARRMSFVAKFLQGGKHLTREKALGVYGPRLQKYAKQLAKIAMAKKAAQG
jgi:hypothetical protein